MATKYLHVNYQPEASWVLTIMSKLLNSGCPSLRKAFDQWSETPLKELGLAIATRMQMLGRGIHRLNRHVDELREEIKTDRTQLDQCLANGYAFQFNNKELPYELLLDMDSFIFETRSLYEIMGKFLVVLFEILFERSITEEELQAVLCDNGIDTRWIAELRENRKLFFHRTAPWLAIEVQRQNGRYDPVLLKRNTPTHYESGDMVSFAELRAIYEGFVNSATELHRFVMEQIRVRESQLRS